MAHKQTAGRDRLGHLAPKFAELNDDVLFGEVWSREEELSARDRSLVTIAALFSAGLYPQLESHLKLGRAHGITGGRGGRDPARLLLRLAQGLEHLSHDRPDLGRRSGIAMPKTLDRAEFESMDTRLTPSRRPAPSSP